MSGLRGRLEELEKLVREKDPNEKRKLYQNTYRFLEETDHCNGLGPHETEEDRRDAMQEESGTEAEFVKERMERRKEHDGL